MTMVRNIDREGCIGEVRGNANHARRPGIGRIGAPRRT
jgi:hypothetical protein